MRGHHPDDSICKCSTCSSKSLRTPVLCTRNSVFCKNLFVPNLLRFQIFSKHPENEGLYYWRRKYQNLFLSALSESVFCYHPGQWQNLKPPTRILFKFNYFPVSVNVTTFLTAAAAKSLQSCLTLCDPIDSSPLGSSVPGILQARTLEWVAISFSNAWQWKVKVKSLSRARLLATPWTAAHQAPPSMGFSRQEYWSGVPLPSSVLIELPKLGRRLPTSAVLTRKKATLHLWNVLWYL